MLVRLLPDQISDNWDTIKYAIRESVPPTFDESPETINNIFESLLLGSMVCWASVRKDEEGVLLESIIITAISEDKNSKTRNLLIYCVYSFAQGMSGLSWEDGLEQLKDFARVSKCSKIIGYTTNPSIIKYCERIDANIQTFVAIPVLKKLTEREDKTWAEVEAEVAPAK